MSKFNAELQTDTLHFYMCEIMTNKLHITSSVVHIFNRFSHVIALREFELIVNMLFISISYRNKILPVDWSVCKVTQFFKLVLISDDLKI
jgi:hypothetical protein